FNVFQRGAQTNAAGDVGCTGLELPGQVVVRGLVEAHRANHVAAALVRDHVGQQVLLAVERPDAGGTEYLVSGEGVVVGVQCAYVDGHVRDGLRTIHHDDGIGRSPCRADHVRDRVDRPQRIGNVDDADYPRVFRQQ